MKIISKDRAARLCQDWYSGTFSALYSFGSSQKYIDKIYDRYIGEIRKCSPMTVTQKRELESLIRFFNYKHKELN